jgi:outer membrane beta-barrel protein
MGYVGRQARLLLPRLARRARRLFCDGIVPRDAKLNNALHTDGGLPEGIPSRHARRTRHAATPRAAGSRRTTSTTQPRCATTSDSGLTRNQWLASADLVFTPFAGKLGLFSALFTEYDIYLFGGLGVSNWARHYPNAKSTSELLGLSEDCRDAANPNSSINEECALHPVKPDTGVKIGPSFGGGMHIFMADWISLNLEFQDIMSFNNIAGLNRTTTDILDEGRVTVNRDDANWNHNVTFQLGVKIYLPPKAKRSDLKPAAK